MATELVSGDIRNSVLVKIGLDAELGHPVQMNNGRFFQSKLTDVFSSLG